jgi:glycosyltransferase involved in cell wall biosynthesis
VLEALSCGLPVVCLNVGGPGLLVDATCGIRVAAAVPSVVVEELSQALTKLAEDPALRQSMRAAAVLRTREQFSWSRQAARMERLYLSVQTGRQTPRYGIPPPVERRVG